MTNFKIIQRQWIILTSAFLLNLGCLSGQNSSENLVLGKNYTLSIKPNFKGSNLTDQGMVLTNGVVVKKLSSKDEILGWKRREKIEISFNLGTSDQPIGEVAFHTFSKTKTGINYPKNVFVYLSEDGKNYSLAGDAAEGQNTPSGDELESKNLVLSNINKKAKFVKLVVIPDVLMVICDEIQIFKTGKPTEKLTGLTTDVEASIGNIKKEEFERNYLMNLANQLGESVQSKQSKNNMSAADLSNQLKLNHSAKLYSTFKSPFIVESANPWDSITEFRTPIENKRSLTSDFRLNANNVAYGSFILTNSSQKNQIFNLKSTGNNLQNFKVDFFLVQYVYTQNYTKQADALIPITDSFNTEPGISMMVFYKVTGKTAGSATQNFTFENSEGDIDLKISATVLGQNYSKDQINANVWAYLNKPMLKEKPQQAVADLAEHGINTIVLPPTQLPKPGSTDFSSLKNYLKNFKKIDILLLYLDYKTDKKPNNSNLKGFLSDKWKSDFINWYNKVTQIINEEGFSSAKVYLYPYDEVNSPGDIENFKNLITWAKTAIPNVKFYATIANPQAAAQLINMLDIVQIGSEGKMISQLPPTKTELWIYKNAIPARSAPPYKNYRLMAWRAFLSNITGIGFWNYGAQNSLNLPDDLVLNPGVDVSVVYNKPDGSIISSRRWEAFRLGIEDYAIIKNYAKRFGTDNAKTLVNQVVSQPQNLNKADEIKTQMLQKLTQ